MARSPRARRWLRIAAVFAVLALLGAWWVNRQLEPQRLARTVLDRAGAQFGLDLRFQGEPDYALRPEPRLVLPGFSARGADGKPFLSARRLEISLPWDTLTGGEPVITRLELDAPTLDLPTLQRWLATRPPEPFKLPTLSKGLELKDGTVLGDGWSVHGLALLLPTLAEGQPADLVHRGEFRRGELRLGFDGRVQLATAGQRSSFVLRELLTLQRKPKPLKAELDGRGHFDAASAVRTLRIEALALKADSPLPTFDGRGVIASGRSLAIDWNARLLAWPEDWPQLPDAIAGKDAGKPLPLVLRYRGDASFDGPLSLHAEREATVLDARLRVPEFMAWFDDRRGAVLPPLTGSLRTPSLEVDGIRMEGVEIEMSPEAPTP